MKFTNVAIIAIRTFSVEDNLLAAKTSIAEIISKVHQSLL